MIRRCVVASLWTVLAACGEPVVDHPDATFAWPEHRATVAIPDAGLGLVSNNGSDQVSFLDLGATQTIANIQVGIDPIANDGPHHLAVDPTNGHMFVALSYPPPGVPSGPHAGHGSSQSPGWVQLFDLADMHEIARTEVDPNPGDIVITPDRTQVLVSHFNLTQALSTLMSDPMVMDAYSNLWILDANDLHRLHSFPICITAHGMAVTADGHYAYVACYGQDSLAIVDLTQPDAMHVRLIPVGPSPGGPGSPVYGPYSVLITADQQYAIVSDNASHDVRVFNLGTQQFEPAHSIRLPGAAFFGAESEDGQFFLIPFQTPSGIARIDRATWQIATVQSVGASDCLYPHEISRGPDGRFYLVCEAVGSDTQRQAPSRVDVVDPNTLMVTAHFDVGVYPDRVVFVPGAGR